eukprot:TRINITY_DN22835_c0_g1_i1.p1 TRINITY_DN22835_c0_g1~~TRINITY_DN22835_c0_g1_i1.p1  ORF type:complete len:636 (+),score=223.27 TRINITY_DN22835_c0_g1_i1:117-2024(+)
MTDTRRLAAAAAAGCTAVGAAWCCRWCLRRRAAPHGSAAALDALDEEGSATGSRAATPAPPNTAPLPSLAAETPLITWEERRMGLEVTYDTTHMQLRLPIHRRAPFAVLFFDVLSEDVGKDRAIGAAVTVQVHDCCGDASTLKEYVDKSLETLYEIEEELVVEPLEATTLSGQPAIQFCYNCVDSEGEARRVFTVVAQLDRAVYSMSYSSPRTAFSSLQMVKDFAARIKIARHQPSDSFFTFTDPKYGIALQYPVSGFHVRSTAATGRSWKEVVQLRRAAPQPGGAPAVIRLDAEPADIPILDDGDDAAAVKAGTASSISGLRYVAQLYRQQAMQDAAAHEEILWVRLDEEALCLPGVPPGTLVPNERGRRDTHEVANSLTRSLTLGGGVGGHDIEAVAFAYHKTAQPQGDATLCLVYMWLAKGDLFILSAECDTEDRADIAKTMWRMANTLKYGEQHGQSAVLLYTSVQHCFTLQLPPELTAFEPFTGDPYVVYSTPAAPAGGRGAAEFYVQVRVLDVHDEEEGEGLEEVLVSEMGELAAQDAMVHGSKVTQLAGCPSLEIIFTSVITPYRGCADVLALPPQGSATTLRMVTVAHHMKFTIEFVAAASRFPQLADTVFADMLGSFALTRALPTR